MNSLIAEKIASIRTIFQDARLFAETQQEPQALLSYLSAADKPFSVIACEGLSMGMALKDLDKLEHWNAFLKQAGNQYELQLYVGLGWALAQESRPPLPFLSAFPPLVRYRVLDGYGYYDGTCRSRHSIRSQKVPEDFTGAALSAYTQGIGRSVWYLNLGDAAKIAAMIAAFSAGRQPGLWRGVGSAATFVGGSDAAMLEALSAAAAQFQPQLAAGAALAVRTRILSGTLTADTEAACYAWCRQTPAEALQATEKALERAAGEKAYEQWIEAIDRQYASTEVMS